MRYFPTFEAAFWRQVGAHELDTCQELLSAFEVQATADPRRAGEAHAGVPGMWVYQSPRPLGRVPPMVIVYTIDDDEGFVDLWNLYRL